MNFYYLCLARLIKIFETPNAIASDYPSSTKPMQVDYYNDAFISSDESAQNQLKMELLMQ